MTTEEIGTLVDAWMTAFRYGAAEPGADFTRACDLADEASSRLKAQIEAWKA